MIGTDTSSRGSLEVAGTHKHSANAEVNWALSLELEASSQGHLRPETSEPELGPSDVGSGMQEICKCANLQKRWRSKQKPSVGLQKSKSAPPLAALCPGQHWSPHVLNEPERRAWVTYEVAFAYSLLQHEVLSLRHLPPRLTYWSQISLVVRICRVDRFTWGWRRQRQSSHPWDLWERQASSKLEVLVRSPGPRLLVESSFLGNWLIEALACLVSPSAFHLSPARRLSLRDNTIHVSESHGCVLLLAGLVSHEVAVSNGVSILKGRLVVSRFMRVSEVFGCFVVSSWDGVSTMMTLWTVV